MGAFGDKLRKQREHRGITLDAVANTTKISTRMLKALEDEHFDQLPGGVFNKGFVRAYARQVGLNEEEAVNDYLAALGESQIHSQPIVPNFRNTATQPAFEKKSENKVASKAESKSLPEIRADLISSDAAERRTHPERRIEARRTQDRPSFPARTDGYLREEPATPHPMDAARALDLPKAHGENEDRPKPPFIAESTGHGEGHSAINANPRSLEETHRQDRSESQPDANSYENYAAGPPSFLNLSGPSQSYEQPENAEPEESIPAPAVRRSFSQPFAWRKLAIPSLIIVVVILFVVFLRRNHPAPQTASDAQPASPVPAPTAPATGLPPLPANTSATIAGKATAPTPPPSSSRLSSEAPTQTPTEAPTGSNKPSPAEPTSDVTKIIPPRAHPSKTKPLPAFTLIIRASENTSVAITADGQPVSQENLIAPAATSVRATKEIVVKASNAAGVSFMLNGKDIPATGTEGQPQTFTFDANGLRNPASVENPTN